MNKGCLFMEFIKFSATNTDFLNCAVSYLIHYLYCLIVSVTDCGFKLYETRGSVYIGQLTLVKAFLLVADHFISPVFETVRL